MIASLSLAADVLVHATPIILTGLAVAIAFQAGVWNIGADGQLLIGAAAAAWVGVACGGAGFAALPLAIVAGAVAGGGWAWIAAVLRSRYGVLEVISTIMLNFIATYVVSYLVRGPLQEPTRVYPQTSDIAEGARIPIFVPGTRLHMGFLLAVALAVGAWWVLKYTARGFAVRASGSNPHAAASAGLINVARTTSRAFVISGAIAGIAGAVEVTGVTYALYENLSPGYGYTGIAVALLAGLNPIGVVGTGILFGALETGAGALQRDAGIPSTTAGVAEATAILAVIAAAEWRRRRLQRIA